ncbi:MAG TPA: sensor histidine kinase [Solirubrobacteraceae bacterium]|nr:sensor histidine kinase [Solirubrobacteraceae bacterium]
MTATVPHMIRDGGTLVHAALLYRHPDQLRVTLEEFVRDAGRAGEPCLVAMPGAHLVEVGDALSPAGATVRIEDMATAGRNPWRLIPMLCDWIDAQDGPARVVSEVIWPERSAAETAECLRHEAVLNIALAERDVSVLCPYDAAHLAPDVLEGAELTHPHLIDELGVRPSLAYADPVEVARGERWPPAEPPSPVSELPFDGDLGRLRHALASDPLLADLDPGRRADLVLAVDEAASNAVKHGDGVARARVWRDGDEVIGEVATATAIEDPLAGLRTPRPDDVDGRGLWLIHQLCDLVEIRSDGGGARLRMHVGGSG